MSAQGVALVAWVGASVAQVEALRADLMYLDAGLICLVPGLVLHVHGLAKKSCKSRVHFGLGKVDENGGHASLPP